MGQNVFEILGLPLRFDLDAGAIEAAYLARAAGVHPDIVGDDAEAARASARLNDAKRVIEDPERRANELLAVQGGPTKEQDKSLPPGFLMEMMETREEIEAAAGDAERMAGWRAWAEARRGEHVRRVGEMFARARGDAGSLKEIRMELNAWRYIERLIEQLGL